MTEAAGSYRGGAGTPMVLLHGVSGSWRIWKPIIPLLEDSHELHVLTLPGHRGGPPLAPGAGSVTDITDLVELQLDAVGLGTAHLVGNSLGGAVALELARRGRARSVVVFAPSGGWSRPRDRELLTLKVRLGRLLTGRGVEWLLVRHPALRRVALRAAAERGDLIPADEVAGLLADVRECTALAAVIAAARRANSSPRFETMPCPVRIAWPEHDRTLPYGRYGAPLLEAMPGAELVRLPRCGHVPMYDDPALVARTILAITSTSATESTHHTPNYGGSE